jgi:hypothetical protein
MFARSIAYKLTDIFYLWKKRSIFPGDVFDISDDSVVHHWKARGRQSSSITVLWASELLYCE